MAVWPVSLPTEALAGTHRKTYRPNVIVFQPDVGSPIVRQRYEGWTTSESWRQALTKTQKDILENFWLIDCAQGALSFQGALIDGVVRTWSFEPDVPPDFENIRGGTNYWVTLQMRCSG